MEVKKITDLPKFIHEKYPENTCFSSKKAGVWKAFSSDDYIQNSDKLSWFLLQNGIKKGDAIATITNNRPEWNFTDIGLMQIGAVHVPVYPTISDEELIHIINEAEVKIIFLANNFLLTKTQNLISKFDHQVKIISYDKLNNADYFGDILEQTLGDIEIQQIEQIANTVEPNDIATIIYTSGTTSVPKGVMLSHHNLVSNFIAAAPTMELPNTFKTLSFLPVCHVYERMLNYMYQYLGISIYYAETAGSIMGNFKEVKPDVINAVPLLLEKVYAGILEKGSVLTGFKKKLFDDSVKFGAEYNFEKKTIKHFIFDKLIYKKWREAMGGKLVRIICGGAALQEQLLRSFWAAGIPVYEGYGLTETSPLISNNNFRIKKMLTVGKILEGVQVRISEEKEILIKSPGLMQGYYKNPELTASVIDSEGWFHTGDTGAVEQGCFLKITGRIKEIFKTSSGIYVVPETIENKLKQSQYIQHALVVGANKNYLTALIVPDFERLKKYCESKDIRYNDIQDLVVLEPVLTMFSEIIDTYNLNARESELIKRFKVLHREWTVESGELTPKMSLRRNIIIDKNALILREIGFDI